jgi:hypothetical protein
MTAKPISPDPEHVAAIVAHFEAATPEHVAAGCTWYLDAYGEAEAIAARYDLQPRAVAGAIAALSPLREWGRNVEQAADLARAVAEGGEVPVLHFAQNLDRALACLQGADPAETVTGPKVSACYRAIMGDASAVTIDRWAILAATGAPAKGTPTARQYQCLQAAYTEAADA